MARSDSGPFVANPPLLIVGHQSELWGPESACRWGVEVFEGRRGWGGGRGLGDVRERGKGWILLSLFRRPRRTFHVLRWLGASVDALTGELSGAQSFLRPQGRGQIPSCHTLTLSEVGCVVA